MRISDWSSDVCSSDLRQKVAIGRALLKHPCLLILHDATASLDSASRTMLFDTVLEHTEGRGLVWVADQIPTPERFDRIVLFQGGRVVGQGSYDELRNGANGALVRPEERREGKEWGSTGSSRLSPDH